jgi:hypothetical protein
MEWRSQKKIDLVGFVVLIFILLYITSAFLCVWHGIAYTNYFGLKFFFLNGRI